MTFSPKVAYITGGSSGIGKAFAEAFHKRGIQVVIGGRRANKLQARRPPPAGYLSQSFCQCMPVGVHVHIAAACEAGPLRAQHLLPCCACPALRASLKSSANLLTPAQAVCEEFQGMKHVEVDVSDPKSVQEAWGRVVEMFPDIDCVVNNAGLMQPLDFNVDGAQSNA